MKKNFVKKTLASTLALAMVATAMPAAFTTASAAKAPALNKTSKTLYINDNEIGSSFDFNISNKVAKSTYKWTTSNKAVATVNSKGLTKAATKTGKATISCKITLPTKKTKTLKATVTVKENATKVWVKNAPEKEIGIGEKAYDFNSAFSTASGATATDYRQWQIEEGTSNTAGATIDAKSGVVTTKTAGEFKVRVVAYQNKAKLAANDTSAESDWLTVKVVSSVLSAAQSHSSKVAVTFDDNMKDKLKTSDFAIKNKSTNQVMAIKGLSYSDDGKVVTVETFVSYSDAANYVLTFGGKDFDFATTIGEPATIEILTSTAVVNEETEIKIAVKNANGVDITDLKGSKVSITEAENSESFLYGGKITIYKKDAVAKLKATYHSGEWNSDGTEKNVVTTTFQIVGVDKSTVTYGNILYTITDNTDKVDMSKVTTPVTSLSISDGTKYLHINAKASNNTTITEKDGITFSSSDVNVLLVDPATGAITGVKAGNAYVLVKKGDVTLGTVQITVLADRKAASLSLDTYELTLSNKADGLTKSVKVTVKDQHGAEVNNGFVVTGVDAKSQALITDGKVAVKDGNVVVSPFGVAKDTYKFFVKATNTVNGNTIQNVLTVNVVTTTDETASTYRVELSSRTMDAIVTKESEANKKITINLVGYNSSGVQVAYGSSVSYKVTDKDGNDVTDKYVEATATSLIFNVTKKDGNVVTKAPAGTYKIEATVKGTTAVIGGNFVVTDTQALPYVVQNKQVVDVTLVKDATGTKATNASATEIFKAAFDTKDANGIKLGDAGSKVTSVEVVDNIATGTTLFVKKIKVTQQISDGLSIVNELDVNLAIVAK